MHDVDFLQPITDIFLPHVTDTDSQPIFFLNKKKILVSTWLLIEIKLFKNIGIPAFYKPE